MSDDSGGGRQGLDAGGSVAIELVKLEVLPILQQKNRFFNIMGNVLSE